MSNKAPSEGQKVDLGQNAPAKNEPAGVVPSGSLAAESNARSGEFASNVGIHGENTTTSSSTSNTQSSSTYSSTASNTNLENQKSYAGSAPSYVNNQYVTSSAPHGKNISEVSSFDNNSADGVQKAMGAEPGSTDDPARRAEYQMELNNNAVGRAGGPTETGFTNETKYDALNAERPS